MKFLTITLRGIRNFDKKIIQFQDGLNIVCGLNESGKSTILDSLLFCITGTAEHVPSLIKWGTEYSRIDLVYKTDTKQIYTLSRVIYPRQKSKLENKTIIENPETIKAVIQQHFGSDDRRVFENSSVVKQNQMEILENTGSKRFMKAQIQFAITGAERTTEEVLAILQENLEDLKKSAEKIRHNTESCEAKLRLFAVIDEQYSKLTTKLRVYREDLKEHQKKYNIYTDRIHYSALLEDIRETQKAFERIENIEGYINAIPFAEVAEAEALQKELTRTEKGMERLISHIKEKEEDIKRLKTDLSRLEKGFSKLFMVLFGSKKKEKIEKGILSLGESLKTYKNDFYEMETAIEDITLRKRCLVNKIGDYSGKSLDYINQIKEEYQKEILMLLNGLQKEELKNSLLQKQKDVDNLRSAIFRVYPDLLNKNDQQIQSEKEDLEHVIEMLQKEIESSRITLKDIEIRKRERDRIQSGLNAVKAQKEELQTKREVDQIVLETLSSTYAELKDLFIPRLEEKAGRILNKITRGKYQSMSIQREDLDIQVGLPDRTVTVTSLSQGTKDQLHLSLRIALSELLSGGRNLPLLFDESFYTSDEKRLNETFGVLKDIARTTQVILFTHNEDFLQHGNPIILESAGDTLNGA